MRTLRYGKRVIQLLGLTFLACLAASPAHAQVPQSCSAAEVYWSTTQASFFYHCPGGSAWVRVPLASGGGTGLGLVTSVFTRQGDVTAQTGDYTAAQVTNAFNLATSNDLGIHYFDIGAQAVPANPPTGRFRIYLDSSTNLLACISSTGSTCAPSGGGGGAVSSVFGRTGAVTAQSGDYTFSQVSGLLSLNTQVSGNLSTSNLNNGTGASSLTFWRGDGTWAAAGVSSVSSGNASPLFNVTVNTPTTTPAFVFSLSNAGAHQYFGNNTGSTGAPSYFQPAFTDMAGTCQIAQGCTGQTTANAALNALLPSQGGNAGKALQTDGTNSSWQAILTNPMTTLGDFIYGGTAGAPTRLAGPTAVNGVTQVLCEIPSGGLATAPLWCSPGVPINAQTGTTYTLLPSDTSKAITTSNVSAFAGTIPQAGSTGFQLGYVFVTKNVNTGLATWTPTISTIDGLTSRVVAKDEGLFVYNDGTDYKSIHTVAPYSVSTFTNKTYDTAGAGNVFKIAGTAINAISGNTGTVASAGFSVPGSPKCAEIDTSGNIQVAGSNVACQGAAFYQLVGNNGTSQTARNRLNFIPGTNVTFTFADNSGSGSTDLTINSSGGGGTSWSGLTNPSGNMLLTTMGTNLSEWDYTTALANAWKITNVTAATVTVPQSSPVINLACGQEWTGAGASTEGCLRFQFVPAVGLNAQATVKYSLITSSTNTNPAHIFTGKVYTDASTGSFNVNTQGNRNAVMDQSGFEAGSATRGFYFSNTANIDGGGPDAGMTRFGAGLVAASNGSASNRTGLFVSGNNLPKITSDYTNATTTPSTFQTWTLPAVAVNYSYECRGVYQASASTATLALSVNSSVAPTSLMASARVFTTLTGTSTDATITTTSSGNQAVLTGATPNATATNYQFNLYGTIEEPSAGGTFAIQAAAGGTGTVTILRGSTCTLY